MNSFSEIERETISSLLRKRYGKNVSFEEVECELDLGSGPQPFPAIYWFERGANFVLVKARGKYRSQFFYTEADHYGTGRMEYDDLEDCVKTLLQVQADHESAAVPLPPSAEIEDYHGPSMI